jgi:hypothetical protein
MATYDLAFHTRLDGYAVLQTFVETGIQVGDSVVIAGASHGFNGTQPLSQHKTSSSSGYLTRATLNLTPM